MKTIQKICMIALVVTLVGGQSLYAKNNDKAENKQAQNAVQVDTASPNPVADDTPIDPGKNGKKAGDAKVQGNHANKKK